VLGFPRYAPVGDRDERNVDQQQDDQCDEPEPQSTSCGGHRLRARTTSGSEAITCWPICSNTAPPTIRIDDVDLLCTSGRDATAPCCHRGHDLPQCPSWASRAAQLLRAHRVHQLGEVSPCEGIAKGSGAHHRHLAPVPSRRRQDKIGLVDEAGRDLARRVVSGVGAVGPDLGRGTGIDGFTDERRCPRSRPRCRGRQAQASALAR